MLTAGCVYLDSAGGVVEVDLFLSLASPQQVKYYVAKVLGVETEFPC